MIPFRMVFIEQQGHFPEKMRDDGGGGMVVIVMAMW